MSHKTIIINTATIITITTTAIATATNTTNTQATATGNAATGLLEKGAIKPTNQRSLLKEAQAHNHTTKTLILHITVTTATTAITATTATMPTTPANTKKSKKNTVPKLTRKKRIEVAY